MHHLNMLQQPYHIIQKVSFFVHMTHIWVETPQTLIQVSSFICVCSLQHLFIALNATFLSISDKIQNHNYCINLLK